MLFRLLICLLALLSLVVVAAAGEIHTLDGKTYHGQIALLDSGKITVANGQETTTLDLSQISRMLLGDPAKLGGHGLVGEYFADQDFTDAKGERLDPTIDFKWPANATVIAGVSGDSYSIRWTGQVKPLYSEQYTFSTTNDDDARVWINNQQLLESWTGGYGSATGTISLQAGLRYDIRIEYVNRRRAGFVHLFWESPSQTKEIVPPKCLFAPAGADSAEPEGGGLRAEYFGQPNLQQGRMLRLDPEIDFTWHGSPDPSIGPKDPFSVRWSGLINPQYTGTYTFYTHTTGGVRLLMGSSILIDDWNADAPADHSATIALDKGKKVNITMEYFYASPTPATAPATGPATAPAIVTTTPPAAAPAPAALATAILKWSSDKQKLEPVPSTCLFPDPALFCDVPQIAMAFDEELPPPSQGMMLTDGSIIPVTPAAIDPHGTVTAHWGKKDLSLPANHIAMVFQDRTVASTGWAWPGDAGALLRNGDFVQGDIQSFADGKVRVSSILFGFKDYQLGELQAVLFRKPSTADSSFLIRCNDGSAYTATSLTFKDNTIVLDTDVLGQLTFPTTDVYSIKNLKPAK